MCHPHLMYVHTCHRLEAEAARGGAELLAVSRDRETALSAQVR